MMRKVLEAALIVFPPRTQCLKETYTNCWSAGQLQQVVLLPMLPHDWDQWESKPTYTHK
jgi:hypothetical protein